MQRIFISYSRKDIDFVRKIAGDLEKAGYDVWWDITDLRGGDDWVRTIPTAIETSQFIIVVLSPNSISSEWVEKEYTQALSLHRKIIPIMLASCTVPFALNTINYINFSMGDYADNLQNLLDTLGYTGKAPILAADKKRISPLSPKIRKVVIPIFVGLVILLTFALTSHLTPAASPTTTFTLPASGTPSPTPKPATATASLTFTSSPTFTATETSTSSPTLTASPTKPTFEILIYCVNSPYAYAINVRSGPGTNYPPLGEPLLVGKCLAFRAQNEEETWLLVAPAQGDPALQQYEGGWIFRDLLGLGTIGSIGLPVVTLTPTPIASDTPTATPTNTPTMTLTSIPSLTESTVVTPTP